MIQVSSISKSFGGRTLFEDLSFTVSKNEIVGLVGRNGCGKSTLFKILLGEESYEGGSFSIPKNYRLGHLNQHIHFTEATVLLECCQMLPEDEQWDFYKAEKILSGLGFTEEDMHRAPEEFSGGYQLRINLTKCLLQKPDMLLLDEPTNYLDLISMRWMRRFLKTFQGEVIIITHDRDFMDSVSTHTMGLHRGRLIKIPGGTSKYYEQLEANEELYEKTREKQEKKIKHMQQFVDRFRAQAAKATQAQSKLKQIEKLGKMEELQDESDIGLKFHYKNTPAKTLMKVSDLSFGFNKEEAPLFKGINFNLKAGDRVAIIGKNGKGKTTLLNVLAGDLEPLSGQCEFHPATTIGYYQQTNKKNLNPKNTVAEEIELANTLLTRTQSRAICGAMMFSGDDADKKISVLSGGEQGRVLLGKILANPANLLLLDEPTNHLDMYSIDILIEELESYPGGVIVVTHSEEMLRRLANKLIIFHRGKAEYFLGTYDEFLDKIGWEEEENPNKKKKQNTEQMQVVEDHKEKSKEKNKLLKEQEEIENLIHQLEKNLEEKNQLAVEWSQGDNVKKLELAELYKEIDQIQKSIEDEFSKLESITEKIESYT